MRDVKIHQELEGICILWDYGMEEKQLLAWLHLTTLIVSAD